MQYIVHCEASREEELAMDSESGIYCQLADGLRKQGLVIDRTLLEIGIDDESNKEKTKERLDCNTQRSSHYS